jgi:hypothetical protein
MFPIWRSSYQDDKATWSFIDLKRHVIGDVEMNGRAWHSLRWPWCG